MSLKATFKGWFGEKMVSFAQFLALDQNVYKAINGLIVPTDNGTTQIDHVVISKYGIFVLETKNMKGWVYGDKDQKQWTQVLYGQKYRFQNPLNQNYKHTKVLSEHLNIPHEKFHSIVFFSPNVTFKTDLPENVMNRGVIPYIKDKSEQVFSDDAVSRIHEYLLRFKETSDSKREHVESLKNKFNSTTNCPRCGSQLIMRTSKTGNQFWGCKGFPKCRYTKPLVS